MDIYISISGRFAPEMMKNKLFINQGINKDGIPVFLEEGSKYNLDIDLCSTQAAFFDFDRDNDLDMFLINHYPDIYNISEMEKLLKTENKITGDRLYQNQNGKFIDISKKAGIINNSVSYGLGVGVSDLNNDEWPDVYISNDYSGKDFLYMNNGNGSFTESINKSMNHISFSSMGNYLADFNNDGWSDVLTLDMMAEDNYGMKASYGSMNQEMSQKLTGLDQNYQYVYNTLQMNNGVFTGEQIPVFSDIAQIAGVSSTDWSWGPLLFDMDNNGYKDLFVANGIMRDFINNDYLDYFEKRYREVIETHKVTKNDFVTSVLRQMPSRIKPNYFFRNRGDLTFEKMNGVWASNLPTCSNGAAYADFDNDGDMDIIVNNSDGPSFIYKNNVIERGLANFLQFKLTGPEKNPVGIGTKTTLKQTNQIQVQEQYLTRGFLSSVNPVIHFGLGSDKIVPEIKVLWPDGKEQVIYNTSVNQSLILSYKEAVNTHKNLNSKSLLFTDVTKKMNLNHKHEEDNFNDFGRESLLSHRMSDLGPALAVGDVNDDGLEDFYIGGAKGYSGTLYVQNSGGFKPSGNQVLSEDSNSEDVKATFFDADNDGDMDLVAGNLGLNYRYKASKKYPFELFVKDFDNNGKQDLVFGYYNNDTLYPLHGLKSSSSQLLFIKQKFPVYNAFARATLSDVYGSDNLKKAMNYKAVNFATCYLENTGDGVFKIMPLPVTAQISSINSIISEDFDDDGHKDMVIAGNMFGSDPETPRNDASIGLFLKGNGSGGSKAIPAGESGLNLEGDVREICQINLGKSKNPAIIVARNNSFMQIVKIGDITAKP
jgi:hypothetical protein